MAEKTTDAIVEAEAAGNQAEKSQAIVREAPEPISKWDIIWSAWKFQAGQWCMQSNLNRAGSCTSESLSKILRKIYKNDDDFKEALIRHNEYYMTEYAWGACILGLVAAMEEERAKELYETGSTSISPESITAVKSSLMGPFAGIGDTIDASVLWALGVAWTMPLALAGNFWAIPLSYLFVEGWIWFLQPLSMWLGYSKGRDFVVKMATSKVFTNVINFAGIVAMVMFGALTAQLVNFSTPGWAIEGTVLTNFFDAIIPGLTKLAPVALVAWLIKKKKVSIPVIIIGIVIFCVILGLLGAFNVPAEAVAAMI